MAAATGNAQVGMTAGAGAWVNAPYQTDTQKLWESLEASRPALPRKKSQSTPRQRPTTERSPPRRHQTPGEKRLGVPLPPAPATKVAVAASKMKPPPRPEAASEAGATAPGEESPAAPPSKRGARPPSNRSSRPASAPKARPPSPKPAADTKTPKKSPKKKAAKSARVLQQPEWDARGPSRRAPGEVVNKYTHRGQLGDTGALVSGGGLNGGFSGDMLAFQSSAVSVADSDITTATGGGRPSRVTASPTGKMHPNPERKAEIRQADMFSNINYFATTRVGGDAKSNVGDAVYGAPDNDRRMKEASWMSSQAWFESLRYYPKGELAQRNDDCEVTFSGNTHGSDVPAEHIENDVRNRVGVACADPGWSAYQLPEPWCVRLGSSAPAPNVGLPCCCSPPAVNPASAVLVNPASPHRVRAPEMEARMKALAMTTSSAASISMAL